MTKAIRTALYVRVSTSGQTVENQLRELHEVAERHGWNVVATFKVTFASVPITPVMLTVADSSPLDTTVGQAQATYNEMFNGRRGIRSVAVVEPPLSTNVRAVAYIGALWRVNSSPSKFALIFLRCRGVGCPA
jgi:hypothetical protein